MLHCDRGLAVAHDVPSPRERRHTSPAGKNGANIRRALFPGRAAALPIVTPKAVLLISRRDPAGYDVEPGEYMLAKRWREHGTARPRIGWSPRHFAGRQIAMAIALRLPISEGFRRQWRPDAAVKRFEHEKGFRLAT